MRSFVAEAREIADDYVWIGVQFNAGRDRYGHGHISDYRVDLVFARTADGADVEPDPIEITFVCPGGAKPSDLNRFAWTRWATIAEAHARVSLGHSLQRVDELRGAHAAAEKALGIAPKRRPGRLGYSPEFYPTIADRYRAHTEQGHRNPTQLIADEDNVVRATAAGWVREARARGYLAPGRKGRAG